jgi:AcrR family transcriptional regulator
MASRRRPGRPPGDSRTREQIAAAARRQFAELGYERTTIRSIAKEAGVDPALVHHFFGSKQRLFLSVTELPLQPEEVLPGVLAGRRSEAGMRLARFSVELWENPEARERLAGILRAAVSEPEAAQMARELATERFVGAISESLGVDDAPLRASLISSQGIGIAMARYILRVEPLASMDPDALVDAIAPTFQNYLTGPVGPRA